MAEYLLRYGTQFVPLQVDRAAIVPNVLQQTRNPTFAHDNEYVIGLTSSFQQDVGDKSNNTVFVKLI